MKDCIRYVSQEHLDTNGVFRWPADAGDRDKVASRLLGACIVDAMDGGIEKALASLPADFSADQQPKARSLLFRTIAGIVVSILAKLDQFPSANFDMVLTNLDNEEKLASVVEGDTLDLHDRLPGWLKEFSEFAKEFG